GYSTNRRLSGFSNSPASSGCFAATISSFFGASTCAALASRLLSPNVDRPEISSAASKAIISRFAFMASPLQNHQAKTKTAPCRDRQRVGQAQRSLIADLELRMWGQAHVLVMNHHGAHVMPCFRQLMAIERQADGHDPARERGQYEQMSDQR